MKICDFDTATNSVASEMQSTPAVTTPLFAAPETLEIHPKSIVYSEASDVYAFGLVLYCLLHPGVSLFDEVNKAVVQSTGKPKDLSGSDFAHAISNGVRPAVRTEMKVPQWFTELMKRCWSTKPEDRPSWKEILSSIDMVRHAMARHERK